MYKFIGMIQIKDFVYEDIENKTKWMNNKQVNKYIWNEPWKETTLKEQRKWFQEYEKDDTKKFFTIYADNIAIGYVWFQNISTTNKNADIIIVIGEDDYRGKWFGKQAMYWIIEYGFNTLWLHKINLGVVSNNIPAIKLYQSIGFTVEWEMIDEIYYDWKYYNFLSMALFAK